MVKVNLRFGKNKKGGQNDNDYDYDNNDYDVGSTYTPTELPKLTLGNPPTLGTPLSKPLPSNSLNTGSTNAGLMEDILSTLISTNMRSEKTSSLDDDMGLALELSRKLDFSANENPSATTSSTKLYGNSFTNTTKSTSAGANSTPQNLYARFNLPNGSTLPNNLATYQSTLNTTRTTTTPQNSTIETNSITKSAAVHKPLDSDEDTESSASSSSSDDGARKKKKKNKKKKSKKTSKQKKQLESDDDDESTETSSDEENGKSRKSRSKRGSNPITNPMANPALIRKKEITQKASRIENWVQEVNPTDGENNVLDRMKDRHRVEARAVVPSSSQPFVHPDDDRYYGDERGYDRYERFDRHDRYDGPSPPGVPRGGYGDEFRDKEDYRYLPPPPPGARDPRIPGGFVDDRIPPPVREQRGNGYGPDYRDDFRYGPRQAGPRGQYIDDRVQYEDRHLDDPRFKGPNAPQQRQRNRDNAYGVRRQPDSDSNGDETPLGQKYHDPAAKRVPSSSKSSSSSSSAYSVNEDPQSQRSDLPSQRKPGSQAVLSHKSSSSSKNGSGMKEKFRDEASAKLKSNSNHSRGSSFSSLTGHGTAVGNESLLRQGFRHEPSTMSNVEPEQMSTRRSSISSEDRRSPQKHRHHEESSPRMQGVQNDHNSQHDSESSADEDHEPLSKYSGGESPKRDIQENGGDTPNESSHRSSGQESGEEVPTASNNKSKKSKKNKDNKLANNRIVPSDESSSEAESDREPLAVNLPPGNMGSLPPHLRQDYYGIPQNGLARSDSGGRYVPTGYREPIGRYPPGREEPLPIGRHPPREGYPIDSEYPPPTRYRDDLPARYAYREEQTGYDARHGPYSQYREEPPYEAPHGRYTAPRTQQAPELPKNTGKVPLIEMAGYRYDQNKRAPIQAGTQPFLANMGSRIRSPSPIRYNEGPNSLPPPSNQNRGYPPRERGAYPPTDKSGFPPQERGRDYLPSREYPPQERGREFPPVQDRGRDFPPERGYGGPPPQTRVHTAPPIRSGKAGYDGQFYNDRGGRRDGW